MKTGKLSWSLSLLASLFSAPLYAETSVWKVKQGENHLFIGGTIHVLAEADYPLPAEFNRAYQLAERLVLETDIQKYQSPEFQQVMINELTYSDGRNLKSILNAKTFVLRNRAPRVVPANYHRLPGASHRPKSVQLPWFLTSPGFAGARRYFFLPSAIRRLRGNLS